MFTPQTPKDFKNKKVKLKLREEIEPQEVLLDALSQKEELISQRKLEVPLQKKILVRFCFLFLFVFFLFFLKSFQLQILQKKEFSNLAKSNYQRVYFKRANRGVIYDQNFNQLVFNDLSFDLIVEKKDLPKSSKEREDIFKKVSEFVKESPKILKEKIEKSNSSKVLISENLDRETLILLRAKIKEFPGFYIEENIKRSYLKGPTFFHLIGFLGRIESKELKNSDDYSVTDYVGKSGIEKSYEKVLKGEKGKILIERDVKGREISRKTISEPVVGKSLVLWLDSKLQEKIEEALEKSLKRVGAKSGAAVAINPKTGGVLALVSLPSFDNNLFFQKISPKTWKEILADPSKPFFNRAISGTYPTGSTIKPLIAAAALEEKIITPQKKIFCEGKIKVENPWFPDKPWIFHDWKAHGWTDIKKAIAESCNVYFYTIGGGYGNIKGLGAEKIKEYLELFGWGRATGIDIPGESNGLIPDKEWKKEHFEKREQQIWLPGDTYNLSIGQGYLSITPLQVATSFVPIANGGKLLKPKIVKEIIEGSKDSFSVVKEFEPEVVRENFISTENLETVREGMREAVIYGSSHILNDLPVKVASKTGTAQTPKKDYYHNWVTVFAPYEDPEIVLTVMIENVPKEQVAALPVAKEVLSWYFAK